MRWKLFADLADVADDRELEYDLPAEATVADALEALLADRPALAERVRGDDGLREHVNLLRNGRNVDEEAGMATPVDADDELALFPPVSGG